MNKLGCIRDKFDARDYLMRAYLPLVKLPRKVDYTAKLSPVRDQGDEGAEKKGVCRERFWPYRPRQTDKALKGAAKDARKFRLLSYARILNLDELRLHLATKGPSLIGVEVFNGFLKTKTGIVPMPGRKERSLGGHAVCVAGYDDQKGLVKFKNSWSETWGEQGYGFLPYRYIELYMMDAWSSVDVEDPNPLTLASVLDYRKKISV